MDGLLAGKVVSSAFLFNFQATDCDNLDCLSGLAGTQRSGTSNLDGETIRESGVNS
jgi:hypothetical protein